MEKNGEFLPANHTKLRWKAILNFLKEYPDFKVVLQGGYNFFVRYKGEKIVKADFSFEAFAKARGKESEAGLCRQYLIEKGIEEKRIMTEENSAYSKENVLFLKLMLKRSTFENLEEVRIMSLIYHIIRIFPLYKEELNYKILPELAEKHLPKKEVEQYYTVPKGGKKWDVNKILNAPFEELCQ